MKQSLQLLAVGVIFFAFGFFLAWTLSGTTEQQHHVPPSEVFSEFIRDFHENPVFQKKRTRFPLIYITTSNHEEALVDTFLIERAQWEPFMMLDSVGSLVTISPEFCGPEPPSPCRYSVTIQGMHHGEQARFLFENLKGQWVLFAFEDFSM